jgi:hypothetical protein
MDSVAPPPFELDKLPAPAREAVFFALTRFESARACCVSVAFNASLGGPHLWSCLDFTDEAAFGCGEAEARKVDRRDVTPAVVTGACKKASAALCAVTLPQTNEAYEMLPSLVTAHPLLCRVTLVPRRSRTHLAKVACLHQPSSIHSFIMAKDKPEELQLALGACTSGYHGDAVVDLLMQQPWLKLTHVYIYVAPRTSALQVHRLAAMVRAHAHTLCDLHLYCYTSGGDMLPDTTSLDEALCECSALEHVDITHDTMSLLHGERGFLAAFAAAMRAAGTLRWLTLDGRVANAVFSGTDASSDAASAACMLLPSLTRLDVMSDHSGKMSYDNVTSLARMLQHNTTLRTLRLSGLEDAYAYELEDDCDDEDHEAPPRCPLRLALATTQLQLLDIDTGIPWGYPITTLGDLRDALPSSLQELRSRHQSCRSRAPPSFIGHLCIGHL